MNTGLKNKLLIMAAAAGLAGFGVGCSSSEAPAAEEGAVEPTTGGEELGAPEGGDLSAPAAEEPVAPPAEEGGEAAGGEGSCGEGSCS